jgi:hypothetical protein
MVQRWRSFGLQNFSCEEEIWRNAKKYLTLLGLPSRQAQQALLTLGASIKRPARSGATYRERTTASLVRSLSTVTLVRALRSRRRFATLAKSLSLLDRLEKPLYTGSGFGPVAVKCLPSPRARLTPSAYPKRKATSGRSYRFPNGAQGAVKAIEKAFEYVCSASTASTSGSITTSPGKAAKAVADILPPGKAFIVKADLKDANEYLKASRGGEIVNLIWRAEPHRPDGIVAGSEITLEALREAVAKGYTLPYPQLSSALHGLRKRELTLLTAGRGSASPPWPARSPTTSTKSTA